MAAAHQMRTPTAKFPNCLRNSHPLLARYAGTSVVKFEGTMNQHTYPRLCQLVNHDQSNRESYVGHDFDLIQRLMHNPLGEYQQSIDKMKDEYARFCAVTASQLPYRSDSNKFEPLLPTTPIHKSMTQQAIQDLECLLTLASPSPMYESYLSGSIATLLPSLSSSKNGEYLLANLDKVLVHTLDALFVPHKMSDRLVVLPSALARLLPVVVGLSFLVHTHPTKVIDRAKVKGWVDGLIRLLHISIESLSQPVMIRASICLTSLFLVWPTRADLKGALYMSTAQVQDLTWLNDRLNQLNMDTDWGDLPRFLSAQVYTLIDWWFDNDADTAVGSSSSILRLGLVVSKAPQAPLRVAAGGGLNDGQDSSDYSPRLPTTECIMIDGADWHTLMKYLPALLSRWKREAIKFPSHSICHEWKLCHERFKDVNAVTGPEVLGLMNVTPVLIKGDEGKKGKEGKEGGGESKSVMSAIECRYHPTTCIDMDKRCYFGRLLRAFLPPPPPKSISLSASKEGDPMMETQQELYNAMSALIIALSCNNMASAAEYTMCDLPCSTATTPTTPRATLQKKEQVTKKNDDDDDKVDENEVEDEDHDDDALTKQKKKSSNPGGTKRKRTIITDDEEDDGETTEEEQLELDGDDSEASDDVHESKQKKKLDKAPLVKQQRDKPLKTITKKPKLNKEEGISKATAHISKETTKATKAVDKAESDDQLLKQQVAALQEQKYLEANELKQRKKLEKAEALKEQKRLSVKLAKVKSEQDKQKKAEEKQKKREEKMILKEAERKAKAEERMAKATKRKEDKAKAHAIILDDADGKQMATSISSTAETADAKCQPAASRPSPLVASARYRPPKKKTPTWSYPKKRKNYKRKATGGKSTGTKAKSETELVPPPQPLSQIVNPNGDGDIGDVDVDIGEGGDDDDGDVVEAGEKTRQVETKEKLQEDASDLLALVAQPLIAAPQAPMNACKDGDNNNNNRPLPTMPAEPPTLLPTLVARSAFTPSPLRVLTRTTTTTTTTMTQTITQSPEAAATTHQTQHEEQSAVRPVQTAPLLLSSSSSSLSSRTRSPVPMLIPPPTTVVIPIVTATSATTSATATAGARADSSTELIQRASTKDGRQTPIIMPHRQDRQDDSSGGTSTSTSTSTSNTSANAKMGTPKKNSATRPATPIALSAPQYTCTLTPTRHATPVLGLQSVARLPSPLHILRSPSAVHKAAAAAAVAVAVAATRAAAAVPSNPCVDETKDTKDTKEDDVTQDIMTLSSSSLSPSRPLLLPSLGLMQIAAQPEPLIAQTETSPDALHYFTSRGKEDGEPSTQGSTATTMDPLVPRRRLAKVMLAYAESRTPLQGVDTQEDGVDMEEDVVDMEDVDINTLMERGLLF